MSIKEVAINYERHTKPLLQGMIDVHDDENDPCQCEGWSDPAGKYAMGVGINFERGLLCSKCGKKLSKIGLEWFKKTI